MSIGTAWAWQQGDGNTLSGTTTVLGYQQHVATDGASPEDAFGKSSHGYVWAALDVKICTDTTSTETDPVNSTPWILAYDDGTQIEPSDSGYDSFPKPAFPMGDATVSPGRCLRGKIIFPVPGKQRPSLIAYAPDGLDTPKLWTVPAK
ncbi:DUF4352 domain-containing protein [Streptacidiphilus sp. PAMC 29251]